MQYLRAELHKQIYEVRGRKTVTTKLDAPYTVLSIRGQALSVPVSSEVKGKELQAPNMHLQNLMPQELSTATGTTKSQIAQVQRVPKVNDQEQKAQRLIGKGYVQAERMLAKPQRSTEEEETRKAQSETDKENSTRIAEEVKQLSRNPKISQRVAKKIAKKRGKQAVKNARHEIKQGGHKLQVLAKETAEDALMMHQNNSIRGKSNLDSTFAIRFTSHKRKPFDRIILLPEAQDAPPIIVRRHLSLSLDEKHMATLKRKSDVKFEPISESKAFSDDVKYAVPIIREESEGKRPGTAYEGKDGSVFMIRKHATMNPYERLKEIRQVGEISSREQAMGLHNQYHLPLFDEQPEDVRKS